MQSFNQVLSLGPSILSAFLSLYLPIVYFLDCKTYLSFVSADRNPLKANKSVFAQTTLSAQDLGWYLFGAKLLPVQNGGLACHLLQVLRLPINQI